MTCSVIQISFRFVFNFFLCSKYIVLCNFSFILFHFTLLMICHLFNQLKRFLLSQILDLIRSSPGKLYKYRSILARHLSRPMSLMPEFPVAHTWEIRHRNSLRFGFTNQLDLSLQHRDVVYNGVIISFRLFVCLLFRRTVEIVFSCTWT